MAELPDKAISRQLLGVAVFCGIGFTLRLFIDGLVFEHTDGDAVFCLFTPRPGIFSCSLIAGITGYVILLEADPGPEAVTAEKIAEEQPPTRTLD